MSLGFPEIVMILLIALIVFGPNKLPEIGRSLGLAMRELKRTSNSLMAALDEDLDRDEHKPQPPAAKEGES